MKTKAMPAKVKTSLPSDGANGADTIKKKAKNGNGHLIREPQLHNTTIDSLDFKEMLGVLTEVKNGNFKVRMPFDQIGLSGKICDTLNEIISLNEEMMLEFTRAGNTIGKQGKLTQRIEMPSSKGSWGTGINSLKCIDFGSRSPHH
jgi:hypothetical protein